MFALIGKRADVKVVNRDLCQILSRAKLHLLFSSQSFRPYVVDSVTLCRSNVHVMCHEVIYVVNWNSLNNINTLDLLGSESVNA